jgi:hypothetical protein
VITAVKEGKINIVLMGAGIELPVKRVAPPQTAFPTHVLPPRQSSHC